jgi:hypothetical protein
MKPGQLCGWKQRNFHRKAVYSSEYIERTACICPPPILNRGNNCYVMLFDTNLHIFGEVKYGNLPFGNYPML